MWRRKKAGRFKQEVPTGQERSPESVCLERGPADLVVTIEDGIATEAAVIKPQSLLLSACCIDGEGEVQPSKIQAPRFQPHSNIFAPSQESNTCKHQHHQSGYVLPRGSQRIAHHTTVILKARF